MRFSGIFQTISFTVRKRFVNAFLPSPYTVSKPSKNAPKTAKKIRNACGKNPHPLPPSCGSQSPKNRFVRPFFGILQVLALKTPARWPFSHSLCVFTRVLAGDFPTLEQVQGGGFADVANAIQLIFRDHIGNIVPVDCVFFHDNTPQYLGNLCRHSNCPCIAY